MVGGPMRRSGSKGRVLRRLLWLAVACATTSPGFAQTFEDALTNYNRRKYEVARQQFRILAERGDLAAQTYLGRIYLGENDCREAVKWLQSAAARGYAPSQSEIGNMYALASCVPRDCSASESWFLKAAGQHDIGAQYTLGRMYRTGECFPRDCAASESWFLKAAEQNEIAAQFELGHMYEIGECVSPDLVKAHMWFTLTAANFSRDGGTLQRDANSERNMIAAQMTSAQLAEAAGLVQAWKPKERP